MARWSMNFNQTADPKIFVGGDAVNRTADAISAIADGLPRLLRVS